MGCCCSKPVDEPAAGTPSKGKRQGETPQGETPQETQPKGGTQTGVPSKPVDETLAETPPKGGTQQKTQPKGETQGEAPSKPIDKPLAEAPPEGETQGGAAPKRKRARDTAILLLSFASIASEASDLLKPMKAVSEFIKKILEVTKVSFNFPDETSLFTKSQRAWSR